MGWPTKRKCLLCPVYKAKKLRLRLAYGHGESQCRRPGFPFQGSDGESKRSIFQVRISPYCISVAFFNTSFRISCHLRLNFVRVCRHINPNVLCCVHLWVLPRCEAYWLHMQTTTATHSEAFSANIKALSQPVYGWCCI